MWQEAQASFSLGDMVLSKFISLPRVSTEACPEFCRIGGFPATVGAGSAFHCLRASFSIPVISRRTLAISELILLGRIPGGYGLYTVAALCPCTVWSEIHMATATVAQAAAKAINFLCLMCVWGVRTGLLGSG